MNHSYLFDMATFLLLYPDNRIMDKFYTAIKYKHQPVQQDKSLRGFYKTGGHLFKTSPRFLKAGVGF
ncbi:MAG: hypothetical protein D3906_15695 [Candidatus Electrothrix sp. AUS1_2]|nr:hypothetical protein [Candidatus Electrothrix sp. AUS1_2]